LDVAQGLQAPKVYHSSLGVERTFWGNGGTGYMRETPINRMANDARVQSIGGGATEVMLEEVAKRL
jgi:alkylation response protein AidB-like acyl-CoA dehydrogenase